jgi:hypothetical protein
MTYPVYKHPSFCKADTYNICSVHSCPYGLWVSLIIHTWSITSPSYKHKNKIVIDTRQQFSSTVKIKVKFTLEQATKTQRGSRGYSSTLSLTSVLDEDGRSTPRPGCITPRKDPVPIVYEAGWAPGGAENHAPHWDSIPGLSSPTLSFTLVLDRGGWSTPYPGHFTPGKETRYPSYRKLGGPQGGYGQVRKISLPAGFNHQTFWAVVSCCTNSAILATYHPLNHTPF